ncbi:MAG: 6-bladed beta-propeller [Gemmatimonadaceae bacterium]
MALVSACKDKPAAPVACTDCEIVLQRVGEFSDAFDPGALPDNLVFAERDTAGRLYTVSRKKDAVFVFSADGKLIKRLGQTGDGPGEFRAVRRVLIGPADSVYVADWALRINVFSPDLNFARSQSVSNSPSLVLNDGGLIVAEQIRTPERIGYPVHSFRANGEFEKSFGVDTPLYRPDRKLITNRLAANASAGGIWTLPQGHYTFERWDPHAGVRRQSFAVQSSWFKTLAKWPMDETARPASVIESFSEDAGLLWVLFRVADTDWAVPPRANTERPVSKEEYDKTFDWIIEAVAVNTGQVVASKRFHNVLWGRAPSKVLVSSREEGAGSATYDVWLPTLKRRGMQ